MPGATNARVPYDVAKSFLSDHVPSDYYIRPDSCTDRSFGVAHVYVRQRSAQLDVANGDINLNIRDGQLLSYGDSFYRGGALSFTLRLLLILREGERRKGKRGPGPYRLTCQGLPPQLSHSSHIGKRRIQGTSAPGTPK
ncbi:Fungalysin/Thermolysin Extracellular metalloproteinase 5 [Ceratobasidium sp. 395]|nr:Fungalysin/Thermolysin Extracellular metalloproteinase 5 [Ceratobasidium sp. 395]